MRPYRINASSNNMVRDGYNWQWHITWNPLLFRSFTASTPSEGKSHIIYQNTYWPAPDNNDAIE